MTMANTKKIKFSVEEASEDILSEIKFYGVPCGYGVYSPQQVRKLIKSKPLPVCLCYVNNPGEEKFYLLVQANEFFDLKKIEGNEEEVEEDEEEVEENEEEFDE